MKTSQEFEIKVDGTKVLGEITYRSEADIVIRITEPFAGLTHGSHIPYFSRPVNSFLTEYGDKMAENLLKYLYELGFYIKENGSFIRVQLAIHFPNEDYSGLRTRDRFFGSTFPFVVPMDLREEIFEIIQAIGPLHVGEAHTPDYIPIRKLKPSYTPEDRESQRKVVKDVLVKLNTELGIYFDIWKQVGGGTTGYAIDAVKRLVKDADKLFRTKC
jgi:hypothetical protein